MNSKNQIAVRENMNPKIQKIFRRWYKHVSYVAIGIIFALLIFSAGILLQKVPDCLGSKSTDISDYISSIGKDTLLSGTKRILTLSTKLIAFPLISIFLYLIVYTAHPMIRVVRELCTSRFDWRDRLLLSFLVIAEAIFLVSIGKIGSLCLQTNTPCSLCLSLMINFYFLLLIMMIVFFSIRELRFVREKKFKNIKPYLKLVGLTIVLIFALAVLIWYNFKCVWVEVPILAFISIKRFLKITSIIVGLLIVSPKLIYLICQKIKSFAQTF